jgi:hypothetical protein
MHACGTHITAAFSGPLWRCCWCLLACGGEVMAVGVGVGVGALTWEGNGFAFSKGTHCLGTSRLLSLFIMFLCWAGGGRLLGCWREWRD